MTELKEVINARLEAARAATAGPWATGGVGDHGWSVHFPHNDGWTNMGVETDDNEQGHRDADFIAIHNPADAILRYKAELAIIAMYEAAEVELRATLGAVVEILAAAYPEETSR